VFLGNNRVNDKKYSYDHVKYKTISEEDYNDFSFFELGQFDQPAMINFILKKTGKKSVGYVGHS